ncbi:MAG TPA: beta-N-acetylglucosaminidase [Candidatus Aminicenantes bacterium]|nr:beta-N-acetylglucosaminidase [Candidatus Aminicenantes bacterium]
MSPKFFSASKSFFFYLIILGIFLWPSCRPKEAKIPEARYPIIPQPTQLTPQEGEFTLSSTTALKYSSAESNVEPVINFWRERFTPPTGFVFPLNNDQETNVIQFGLTASFPGPEGSYKLVIEPKHILIQAGSARGLFYGVQTLRQLLPPAIESRDKVEVEDSFWKIPCAIIEDSPRFKYRGLHLDVGRHFFPVQFIKKYIDLIAYLKLNYFHWHLTEDQGWRLEIKRYPLLTKTGAFRKQTLVGHARQKLPVYDGIPYGGYYSQEDVHEIVAYARQRFVTIIPEIEMPGHSLAALAAYPHLGCTKGPYQVAQTWGVFEDVYCAGQEETFEFLVNVLSEVIELFPSEYIHIGGDEVPKKRWQECPRCQQRINEEGLKDEAELQSYFIRRIEKFLHQKGRRLIGWDEILEGGLAPEAIVMSWRGTEGGIEAARQKHYVIMTPYSHCYFDYYQADPRTQPLAIGGFLPLKKVYSFEPIPAELTSEEAQYILGAQGNVWTEYLLNEKYVEYMAFPRACALAEVTWTPKEKKDWWGFLSRLSGFLRHLEALDVNYFRGNVDELITQDFD